MKYYGLTDRGLVRRNNQDSYVIAANESNDVFALVCDGIGGNFGGDIASRIAVQDFSQAFSETAHFEDAHAARKWLAEMIRRVNADIYDYGQKHPAFKGMGTTLCGVVIAGKEKYIVNIGDSRAYGFWRNGKFVQLTTDHTLVNDMLMHGELTPEEAKNYPKKNVLTNALGVWETVRGDITVHNEELDGILLCSDGLHAYVDEEVIRSIVMDRSQDPALRAKKLLKAALDAGGFDNVSVILIDFDREESV